MNKTEQAIEEIRARLKIIERRAYSLNFKNQNYELIKHDFYDQEGRYSKSVVYKAENIFEKVFEYRPTDNTYLESNYVDKIKTEYFRYVLDSIGNQTEFIQYNKDHEIVNHQRRVYDKNNLNTELHSQDPYMKTFYLDQKYYYNGQKNLIRIEEYDEGGILELIQEFEYDNKGRQIKCFFDFLNGQRKVISEIQYEDENKIEKKVFSDNKQLIRYYNTESLLIREEKYQENEELERIKYEYEKGT